jgi:hypothetical protein
MKGFKDVFCTESGQECDSLRLRDSVNQKAKLGGARALNPKMLAAAFAMAVTVRCESPACWVARNGAESIFRTLERILPKVDQEAMIKFEKRWQWAYKSILLCNFIVLQVIQLEDGQHRFRLKGRISRSGFNKVLESSCGFNSARTRKKTLTRSVAHRFVAHIRLPRTGPIDKISRDPHR